MKKRHSAEQVVAKLRQADVELGKGLKVPEVCRLLQISEQTYYRWRTKYGGMDPQMAKQLKALEKENASPLLNRLDVALLKTLPSVRQSWYVKDDDSIVTDCPAGVRGGAAGV